MIAFSKILQPKYLVFAVLATYLFFGFQHLTQFVTADEHYWIYERIPQYRDAVAQGKWKKTFINDKPGVSLALVSGIGLLSEPHPETLCQETPERVITCDTLRTEQLLFSFRLPILLLNAFLMLYLFWIIGKISNAHIALWSVIFMAFSPILIGISQILNPDALLWSFSAASIFSYFALLKFHEKKYVLLAGGMLGFAILSKYTASLLIPFFLMVSVYSALLVALRDADKQAALAAEKKNLSAFFETLAIAILCIAIFLPAVWTKPDILGYLLSGSSTTFLIFIPLFFFILFTIDAASLRGRIFFLLHASLRIIEAWSPSRYILPWGILLLFSVLLIGRVAFPDWSLFERIPFDLKNLSGDVDYYGPTPTIFESVLLETNPLIFSLPPILLFFLIIRLFRMPLPTNDGARWNFESTVLLLFLSIYVAVLIFMDVLATPRYLISLYPIASFLAAVGAWECARIFERKFLTRISVPTFIIIIFSLISLMTSHPFYFNYANIFLPKESAISDAWGYGGYEAAQYLNTLPDAENLVVWSDYEGVCEFFKGKCMTKQYKYAVKQSIDYAVVTRRGEILYNPDHSRWRKEGNFHMRPAYRDPDPEWQLLIDDNPNKFIRVVEVKK